MTTVRQFCANYRRYTPEALRLLMRISSALGTIQSARILPAVADQLRASAKAGTVHFSNLIEGNELPMVEAERAARGELDPDSRAKIELINYVDALDLIDRRIDDGSLTLDPELLKQLHATAMRGLGRADDPHFKPHHEGAWRDGVAVIVDRLSGQITHEAPPPDEVSARIAGIFEWLGSRWTAESDPPFVLAGVMHFAIADVHPFADGNGRAARLFQTALLRHAGTLPGRIFSFERYYAEDRSAYYAALRSVRERTLNMEFWLEYFLRGLAEEYERVAATVSDLSSLVATGGRSPLRLTAAQEHAVAALRLQGKREFGRRDWEVVAGVGRSSAGEDLQQLVRYGVLVVRGTGPATRYVFSSAQQSQQRSSRSVKWSDVTIERELREFLKGRDHWPSPAEFRRRGRGDLYSAASRSGGIRRWRQLMGI